MVQEALEKLERLDQDAGELAAALVTTLCVLSVRVSGYVPAPANFDPVRAKDLSSKCGCSLT